jgi:hypothetical protein
MKKINIFGNHEFLNNKCCCQAVCMEMSTVLL